ncbi:MCE family protein [Nocardioides panzhihuensis]|uniref:Phospholipid/cholesterol/gamma-HCH transport system substrate-binding protein n=1 Tax=Nocardioides panzhihuensis TaxID=860243 RepID=A0A7Z0IQD0_9ACTN|nr:phospholipid/cholesterol/gamma-HCH transport system substrate-binding protein [Nocardioides panzhihuensis]
MKIRDPRSLVLVLVFIVTTSLLSAIVAVTLGRMRIEETVSYQAMFQDASGLREGVDVRASGVTVGTVGDLRLREDHQVEVTFEVPADLPLTESSTAAIRWANLTGDRYLEVGPGKDTGAAALPPGTAIPSSRTSPALDLDTVFNGFKPLFRALSPKDVNQLTESIIAITQGQAGAIDALLTDIGSLTQTLADRDELIGSVIDNLTRVLSTIDRRRDEVDRLLLGLADLTHGLAADRKSIGASVGTIGTFTGRTRSLLKAIRPDLAASLDETGRVAANVNADADYVDRILKQYPDVVHRLGRGGTYGSFFNFYLCGIRVKTGTSDAPVYSPYLMSKEDRCVF